MTTRRLQTEAAPGSTFVENVSPARQGGVPGVTSSVYTRGPKKIQMWDMVDGTQTSPFDETWVLKHYLHKLVSRCTACTFSGAGLPDVEKHIEDALSGGRAHKKFEVLPVPQGPNEPRQPWQCSVCLRRFKQRSVAEMHGFTLDQVALAHTDATEATVRRFSLEPPGPVDSLQSNVAAMQRMQRREPAGPEVNQAAQVPRKSRRRGVRGRRRGRGRDQRDDSRIGR